MEGDSQHAETSAAGAKRQRLNPDARKVLKGESSSIHSHKAKPRSVIPLLRHGRMSTQYSKRADPFYPEFAEHVTMHPDLHQKQQLLDQVRRLHGCGQVDIKHINTWFTRYRASAKKKSMQDDDAIRACSCSQTCAHMHFDLRYDLAEQCLRISLRSNSIF